MVLTNYSVLIDIFIKKITKDKTFFNYFNLTDEQAVALANTRAKGYLDEAINRIILEGRPLVDFTDRDDVQERFNFDLTPSELVLIPSLMYEYYLQQDIALIKTASTNYSPTELRVFDPSNARYSFMDIYNAVCEQNIQYLSEYRSCDRYGNYRKFSFMSCE